MNRVAVHRLDKHLGALGICHERERSNHVELDRISTEHPRQKHDLPIIIDQIQASLARRVRLDTNPAWPGPRVFESLSRLQLRPAGHVMNTLHVLAFLQDIF